MKNRFDSTYFALRNLYFRFRFVAWFDLVNFGLYWLSSGFNIIQQRHQILVPPCRFLHFPLLESSPPEVDVGVRFVHHLDDLLLVAGVDGSHGNVPHGSELATIVQVFVFQSEKVPDEPSHHLKRCQNGDDDVSIHSILRHGRECHWNRPGKPQHKILKDGEVVIILGRVHALLP